MMGIAELVLSLAEGLHPSYVGITAQQAVGNLTPAIQCAAIDEKLCFRLFHFIENVFGGSLQQRVSHDDFRDGAAQFGLAVFGF